MEARRNKGSFSFFQFLSQIVKVSLLIIIFTFSIYLINHLKLSRCFPIQWVRIYGANQSDHLDIQETLQPILSRGFFSVNVDYIRERLLQMPWVSEIYVRRHWPDQI